jgi:hypothetical protein
MAWQRVAVSLLHLSARLASIRAADQMSFFTEI